MPKGSSSRTGRARLYGPLPTGAKGGRGQHFLKNPSVITRIISRASLRATDIVLEIGPGSGAMTVELLQKAKKVIAIEVDPRMVVELRKRVQDTEFGSRLEILHCDFLKVEQLPYFDVCVANIPYQISSPIVFKLLAHRPFFRCAVIMFQDEFAQRLSARPGSAIYSRLSVNCQLLAKVTQLFKVGRNNFNPPPKVESRVVRIEVRVPPPPIDFQEWDGMVRVCFNRKNKTCRATFLNKKLLKLMLQNMRSLHEMSACAEEKGRKSKGRKSKGRKDRGGGKFRGKGTDSKMALDAEFHFSEGVVEVASSSAPSSTKEMARMVEGVLTEANLSSKRPSQLDIPDFVRLLHLFNTKGIHFA